MGSDAGRGLAAASFSYTSFRRAATSRDVHADVSQNVSQMRKKGVICNGICVGPDEANFTAFMKQIFGSEFTVCDDYKHVDVFLTKTISNQIIHSLKMANHN